MQFVHPQKAGERNFFHPVSRNPWEVIISGPVDIYETTGSDSLCQPVDIVVLPRNVILYGLQQKVRSPAALRNVLSVSERE